MRQFSRFAVPRNADGSTIAGYIERLQNNISDVLREFTGRPENDSALLEEISLTNGVINLVPHKLNRRIRGWKVVDSTVQATIWRDTTSTADLTYYLPLQTSAAVTVSLEVF